MPTLLPPTLDLDSPRAPDAISALDLAIWRAWMPLQRHRWRRVYANVRIGAGRPAPPDTDAATRAMWFDVTARRIDILAVAADGVEIIELRHDATPNAIGRMLAYRELYRDDPRAGPIARLYIVSDTYSADVERLAAMLGMIYEHSVGGGARPP